MSIFLNFSNHPSAHWGEKQKLAAKSYGEIKDINFPEIDADASEEDVAELAEQYVEEIKKIAPAVVMCQGEFTFSFLLTSKLLKLGIPCVAACSRRVAVETVGEDGIVKRQSVFEFERFRAYHLE